MHSHSKILKAITGVLLIEKSGENKLVCIEDLRNTKHFSIGQLFNAIRVLNDKSEDQYGSKWPQANVGSETSLDWKALSSQYDDAVSDLDFLQTVCIQLGEEMPEVVSRDVVLKSLEKLRHGTLQID